MSFPCNPGDARECAIMRSLAAKLESGEGSLQQNGNVLILSRPGLDHADSYWLGSLNSRFLPANAS